MFKAILPKHFNTVKYCKLKKPQKDPHFSCIPTHIRSHTAYLCDDMVQDQAAVAEAQVAEALAHHELEFEIESMRCICLLFFTRRNPWVWMGMSYEWFGIIVCSPIYYILPNIIPSNA